MTSRTKLMGCGFVAFLTVIGKSADCPPAVIFTLYWPSFSPRKKQLVSIATPSAAA